MTSSAGYIASLKGVIIQLDPLISYYYTTRGVIIIQLEDPEGLPSGCCCVGLRGCPQGVGLRGYPESVGLRGYPESVGL